MRTKLFSLVILLMVCFSAAAAEPTPAERAAWLKEMTKFKHDYFAKELGLTADQQKQFFAYYDAMDAETRKLAEETRALSKAVSAKGSKATDTERIKAAEAEYEFKGKENQIEMKYFAKFKTVLTPAQLLKLRHVERHFNRMIIKEHKKRRDSKQKK